MNTHIALKNTETDAMFIVSLEQGQKMMAEHSTVLKRATPQDLQDGGCSDAVFSDCGLKRPEVTIEVEATEKVETKTKVEVEEKDSTEKETPNLTAKNK